MTFYRSLRNFKLTHLALKDVHRTYSAADPAPTAAVLCRRSKILTTAGVRSSRELVHERHQPSVSLSRLLLMQVEHR